MIIAKENNEAVLNSMREKDQVRKEVINMSTTNNTDNSVNTVVINVHGNIPVPYEQILPALKQANLSQKQLESVQHAMALLTKDGVKTPEALSTFMRDNTVTMHDLEKDIRFCADEFCENAILFAGSEVVKKMTAKDTKQEERRLVDLHLRIAVNYLFQHLVINNGADSIQITSENLGKNPLYRSRDKMSVWGPSSGIENESGDFSKAKKDELCTWLMVQEERFWRTLIVDHLIARLRGYIGMQLLDDLPTKKPERRHYEDPTIDILNGAMFETTANAESTNNSYRENMTFEEQCAILQDRLYSFEDRVPGREALFLAIMGDLKKKLNEFCKQPINEGWFHISDKYTQQQIAEKELIESAAQLRIES